MRMPWWAWAIVGWILALVIFCVAWYVFMRPIKDWEDDRARNRDNWRH